MRRDIRDRLRYENQAELAESKVIMNRNVEQSFIKQLDSFMDDKEETKKNLFSKNNNFVHFDECNDQMGLMKCNKGLTSYSKMHKRIHGLGQDQYSRKIDYEENSDRKRNMIKEQSSIHSSPSRNEPSFKIKYEFSKSLIIKMKDFIADQLVDVCEECGGMKSKVIEGKFVCRDDQCRELNDYENKIGFPLISLLYQIENPSCSSESIESLIQKLKSLLIKIQRQRQEILEMKVHMQQILGNRSMFYKECKLSFKEFVKVLPCSLPQKTKDHSVMVQELKGKLQRINLKYPYREMMLWNKVNCTSYLRDKDIKGCIQKSLPLNLKNDLSNLGEQISIVSDNFDGHRMQLNISNNLDFNLYGVLKCLTLFIDGSCQVKRNNFIMIEKVQRMKIVFESRRTNRELIELFNILPSSVCLALKYDYKLHSHISSETFPFLTKACELTENQLQIKLENSRPQIYDDILSVSKTISKKSILKLEISLNDFISDNEIPEDARNEQWGNNVVKNLIKNVGNGIQILHLDLPFVYNKQEICEFILNSNCPMLSDVKLKSKNDLMEQSSLSNLLKQITNKKKVLFGMLALEKRDTTNLFKKFPEIKSSIFEALF